MQPLFRLITLALTISISVPATAGEWKLHDGGEGNGLVLTYGSDEPVSYRFECTSDAILVTETGVIELMDFATGDEVDDGAALLPSGAAMMAIYSGKGEPEFLPAKAVKNPRGGWDLTLRLPKDDKQLKALGTSEMMSLFTSGYTMAVAMDGNSRASWKDFMRRCKAIG